MINILEKYPLATLLIIAAVVFTLNLDVLYINIMEARNFVTAREMLTENHWVLTTMNDFPRYEKPPLPTWLTAASAAVGGLESLFALRLPAALMGIMLCYFAYKTAVFFSKDKQWGLYSGLILATSFYVVFAGRNGQWDIFTHAFMAGHIYYLSKILYADKLNRTWILWAALFLAASFLSKGPVSLYALWLPFLLAYLLVFRKETRSVRGITALPPILIGLALGLVWFVYVRVEDAEAFIAITREETTNWSSYNVRPFWYYWSFFTQSGLWTIPAFTALLYPVIRTKVTHPKLYRFTLAWTLFAVLLLSVIPEKKSRYLLPVLIPMALNTGLFIQYAITAFRQKTSRGEKIALYLHHSILILICLAFPATGFLIFKDLNESQKILFILTSLGLFGLGLAMLRAISEKNFKVMFYQSILLILLIVGVGLPLSTVLNNNPEFNNIAEYTNKEDVRYAYGEPAPEMVWHLGHPAPNIDLEEGLKIPEADEFTLLVGPSREGEFKRIFAEDYEITLLEVFDINYTAAPGDKKHKDRLVSNYYLLKRK